MSGGLGALYGIGVGPGQPGLLTCRAADCLRQVDRIVVPKARGAQHSTARQCVEWLQLADDKFMECEFSLDGDPQQRARHYASVARQLLDHLEIGRDIAYLTLGDAMTYSTYVYTLHALKQQQPSLLYETIPGITSYSTAAAKLDFPLGLSDERILILPCPDAMEPLRRDIQSHDVVVLMKIASKLDAVLALLREMGIIEHCVLAHRVGLGGEVLERHLGRLAGQRLGYLSVVLIRKRPPLLQEPTA